MTQFHSPISDRETSELITISNSSTDEWQQEAIDKAKLELDKRKIPQDEREKVIEEGVCGNQRTVKKRS